MSIEYLSVVTRKGQITIPAPIRRALGLSEGDRVALVVTEDKQVCISRPTGVVARTAGMLKGACSALTAEELRRAGEDAIAEAAQELSKQCMSLPFLDTNIRVDQHFDRIPGKIRIEP